MTDTAMPTPENRADFMDIAIPSHEGHSMWDEPLTAIVTAHTGIHGSQWDRTELSTGYMETMVLKHHHTLRWAWQRMQADDVLEMAILVEGDKPLQFTQPVNMPLPSGKGGSDTFSDDYDVSGDEGDPLGLACIESVSVMSGHVDDPTEALTSLWQDMPNGTVVAEGAEGGREYVCMRVEATTGHLTAWMPMAAATAEMMAAFRAKVGTEKLAAHAFDAQGLGCMHRAPRRHRPDLAEITPAVPIVPGLPAPRRLGEYAVHRVLAHARDADGDWSMHVQFSVGAPEWVPRDNICDCEALDAYEEQHPYPYEVPVSGDTATAAAAATAPAAPQSAAVATATAAAAAAAVQEQMDGLLAQMAMLSASLSNHKDAVSARIGSCTLEADRAMEIAQAAADTASAAQHAATAPHLDVARLAARVAALEAQAAQPCTRCAALEARVQQLEQAMQQWPAAEPAPAAPARQPCRTKPAMPMTAAQQMMYEHQQRKAEAHAAREKVRRDTNAANNTVLGGLLEISGAKPNLMDGCTGHELYHVLDRFGIPYVDNRHRPRLATIANVHGLTHTLDATSQSPLLMPLHEHFIRGGYVTFGSSTQGKEHRALEQRDRHERAQEPGVLRVVGANKPQYKLPRETDGWKAPSTFSSFDQYMAASHEHVAWVRRVDVTGAEKLAAFYHAMQDEWTTTTTFRGNLRLLTTTCPRLRQHLLHSGAQDWSFSGSTDQQLAMHLAACKNQAELEADRGRGQPPLGAGRGGAGSGGNDQGGGGDAGGGRGPQDAADPSVPLPTTCAAAVARRWGSHNAPAGKHVCVGHTFGTCTNPTEGDGCKAPNGQHRIHVCCFCGKNHPVGKDAQCPAPKRPPQ